MKNEQYKRAAEIFDEAVDLEGAARQSHLDHACGGDSALREYVEQLLAEDEVGTDAFDESRLVLRQEQIVEALGVNAGGSDQGGPPFALPESVGRYRILEKIGEGGMGSVYLAEQEHPRRRVALKMIRPGMVTPGLRKRFAFEAEVLGKLQHPGIAQIHEAGEIESDAGPQPYFAMEYIEGIEVRRFATSREFGVRARLELTARIADAVHHAHQKGIVHRDLKPENVLVVDQTNVTAGGVDPEFADLGQPKILDFGVARATNADLQMTTAHTEIGQLVGTLPYMSPEQVAGDSRELDTRSDIYALGVLMYELLAGKPPFDLKHKPIPEAVRMIREKEPTRLGSVDTVYRGDIDTIARKALEKDCNRRYSSAADFASDIRRFLANEPIYAHPPSAFYQLKKFAQRHKGLVAGLVLTLFVLIVGIVSTTIFALSAIQNEKLASENEELAIRKAKEATQNANRAKKNETRALAGEAAAERNAYRLNLTAAQAVGVRNSYRALEHLDAVPPEFRGWEWDYLHARFNSHIAEYRSDSPWSIPDSIARGRDNCLLAALWRDDRIELIDLESGETLSIFECEGGLKWPCVSSKGTRLSAFSKDGTKLFVWPIPRNHLLHEIPLEDSKAYCTLFDPEGTKILLTSLENPALLFDLETGHTESLPITAHLYGARGVFSPDGARLILSNRHRNTVVYSTEEKKIISSKFLAGAIHNHAWSRDNKLIAVSTRHRTIHIADSTTLDELQVLRGHTQEVVGVEFSPDGRFLASASGDNTVRVWDLARGEAIRIFPFDPAMGGGGTLAFSEDGSLLAAGNPSGVRLWRWKDDCPSVLEGHGDYVYRTAYHPDGSLIASGGYFARVYLWDALTGEPMANWVAGLPKNFLGFTPDGSRLVVGNLFIPSTGTVPVALWDPHAACRLNEPRTAVDQPFFEKFDIEKDETVLHFLRGVTGGSKVVAFGAGEFPSSSSDRTLIVDFRGNQRSFCLRSLETGERLREFGSHDAEILAGAFSPDGRRILSGDSEGVIKVWDLASGDEVATLEGHTREVYTITYSPDGSRIASSGNDATIIVWDAETLEQVLLLRGHSSYVHSLAFSPDGTQLVSGSGDSTLRVWDSVPPAERWMQIRKRRALSCQAEPLVDRLIEELTDPLDVAAALRGDPNLDDDLRGEALRVLLRRSSAPRSDEK